jgi:hypothetical protein
VTDPFIIEPDIAEEQNHSAKPLDPAALTPETVDLAQYYTLDELMCMPSDVVEELWLACPDRPFYEAALKRAVDDTFGADAIVGDIDRLSVIDECLLYYTGQHPDLAGTSPRIPVAHAPDGSVRWFKVSDRIRTRLEAGLPLEEEGAKEAKPALTARTAAPIALLVVTALCVVFAVIRSALGGDRLSEADLTATAQSVLAAQSHETPTPTPLALENLDRPIRAGDDLRDYYPVLLEIAPSDHPSRVFPVQQREVDIAEWLYDDDPDVASAVLGLVVRPVLGIPYTPENAQFLGLLAEGDEIRLRMSTGQTLRFRVTGSGRVSRQEVAIFDQTAPGIVLVLLADPAGDRLVVYGVYPAEQELARSSGQSALSDAVPEGEPFEHTEGLTLTLLEATTSIGPAGSPLGEGWAYLLVDLRIETREAVDTGAFAIEAVGSDGGRYTPLTVDGAITHYEPFAPAILPPGSDVRTTVAFLVPRDLYAVTLRLQAADGLPAVDYALDYTPPGGLTAASLDVLILETVTEGTPDDPLDLIVTARLFNPHGQAITVRPSDVFAVFSPVVLEDAFPVGPAVQPGGAPLPRTVRAGEAIDVTFHFDWNGDPFAGVQIGSYRFVAQLR